jgi:hypothetical protein
LEWNSEKRVPDRRGKETKGTGDGERYSQNIKDNENIYPFRIKEVRDTIIKVSYLKINRNSVLTDR